MQQPKLNKEIPLAQLVPIVTKLIKQQSISAITISGGEPLEQADELLLLIREVGNTCEDILLYTGYTLAQVRKLLSPKSFADLQRYVSVLIDGRYVDGLNDNKSPLIGSTNQQIHYFNQNMREQYEYYMRRTGRQVQNIHYEGKLVSVGIHNKES